MSFNDWTEQTASDSIYCVRPQLTSMQRLDATTKKRYDGKLFKFKKFSINQAFFINKVFFSRVKAAEQKKD